MSREAFFAAVRPMLGGRITVAQHAGMECILDAWQRHGLNDPRWLAYILATTDHETGRRFEPISENLNYTTAARIRAVWPSRFPTNAAAQPYVRNPQGLANLVYGGRMGNTSSGDGWLYRGRGFVQITGKDNYDRASGHVGHDLVANPDLAMELRIAARILVDGMVEGWFTGRKLSDYFHATTTKWIDARRIINADVATNGASIADLAHRYHDAIGASGNLSGAPSDVGETDTIADPPPPVRTLRREDASEAVRELRTMLDALGYDVDGPGPTFGPRTEAAVRAFQRGAGLTVDGIAGPATMAALRAAADPPDDPVPQAPDLSPAAKGLVAALVAAALAVAAYFGITIGD